MTPPPNFGVIGTLYFPLGSLLPLASHNSSPKFFPSPSRSLAGLFFSLAFLGIFALVLSPGVGNETPTPTSGVCLEVRKKLTVSEPTALSCFPKLPGGHRGKGRRSWFSARSYHLCAVSGTAGLEESVAKAGNRDSFGPARNVAYVI